MQLIFDPLDSNSTCGDYNIVREYSLLTTIEFCGTFCSGVMCVVMVMVDTFVSCSYRHVTVRVHYS